MVAPGRYSGGMAATFFRTSDEFREWLQVNHGSAAELLVGFHKKASGQLSITWPESVDEALCFGWIDGVRRNIDDNSYTIRFTPRRPGSTWSAVNVRRAAELTRARRMRAAGTRAYDRRTDDNTAIYSYEQRMHATLPPEYLAEFKADARAWAFFDRQPPGYRRLVAYWVTSAKRDETRLKRLRTLIADSAQGRRIAALARPGPGR
jgi:uncharacterized protein YdeI (YjbR/CyaY-like superfamily)